MYFCLEGVPETEIDLYKVVPSPIGEIITGFGENSDMGSESIFESTADIAEQACVSERITDPANAPTRESYFPAYTVKVSLTVLFSPGLPTTTPPKPTNK
jgi:hypothetical protein